MKLPSLPSLFRSAGQTLLRFPLALLLAATATTIMIWLLHAGFHDEDDIFIRGANAMISCYLGMLLSIAVTVWSERRAWRLTRSLTLQVAVLGLTVVFYFLMPPGYEYKPLIRCVLYGLGLHLLISVAAFSGWKEVNGFWQYNKKLFLRILTSALYTGVLGVGFCLALLAIDQLFNADINEKWYAYIWIALTGLGNTWFFLGGFPEDYDNPEVIDDYPKGLKVFAQYVLLPIITVYMIILYAYLFKIVMTAKWPSGWVAYLILGFSVAGILALLLLYPIRDRQGSKWISGYTRFFYFALIPLEVMLCVAIWKRMSAYGITEPRYFVILLALWLIGITLYFQWSGKKNIQVIPLSLCALAFLSSFGPWGAFAVSRQSQQTRIRNILYKYGLLADGKVRVKQVSMEYEDNFELSAATFYIVDIHGYGSLQPMFHENLDSMMKKDVLLGKYSQTDQTRAVMRLMDQKYIDRWDRSTDDGEYFIYNMDPNNGAFAADGYSYLLTEVMEKVGIKKDPYPVGNGRLSLELDSAASRLHFNYTEGSRTDTFSLDMSPVLDGINDQRSNGHLPPEKMVWPFVGSGWKGKLIIHNFSGRKWYNNRRITSLSGYLLLSPRPGH